MEELRFWQAMEHRVSRELEATSVRRLRRLWCDGLIPSEYVLDGTAPRINGRAWICDGPRQSAWEFTLLLPRSFGSQAIVDWASVLPPERATRWLSIDARARRIEIAPGAAVPDSAEPDATADGGA